MRKLLCGWAGHVDRVGDGESHGLVDGGSVSAFSSCPSVHVHLWNIGYVHRVVVVEAGAGCSGEA